MQDHENGQDMQVQVLGISCSKVCILVGKLLSQFSNSSNHHFYYRYRHIYPETFFLLRLGVRDISNSTYSDYPELWILRYPAHPRHTFARIQTRDPLVESDILTIRSHDTSFHTHGTCAGIRAVFRIKSWNLNKILKTNTMAMHFHSPNLGKMLKSVNFLNTLMPACGGTHLSCFYMFTGLFVDNLGRGCESPAANLSFGLKVSDDCYQ
jgi:hypothetical protein